VFEDSDVQGLGEFAAHVLAFLPADPGAEQVKAGNLDAKRDFWAAFRVGSDAKARHGDVFQAHALPSPAALPDLASDHGLHAPIACTVMTSATRKLMEFQDYLLREAQVGGRRLPSRLQIRFTIVTSRPRMVSENAA